MSPKSVRVSLTLARVFSTNAQPTVSDELRSSSRRDTVTLIESSYFIELSSRTRGSDKWGLRKGVADIISALAVHRKDRQAKFIQPSTEPCSALEAETMNEMSPESSPTELYSPQSDHDTYGRCDLVAGTHSHRRSAKRHKSTSSAYTTPTVPIAELPGNEVQFQASGANASGVLELGLEPPRNDILFDSVGSNLDPPRLSTHSLAHEVHPAEIKEPGPLHAIPELSPKALSHWSLSVSPETPTAAANNSMWDQRYPSSPKYAVSLEESTATLTHAIGIGDPYIQKSNVILPADLGGSVLGDFDFDMDMNMSLNIDFDSMLAAVQCSFKEHDGSYAHSEWVQREHSASHGNPEHGISGLQGDAVDLNLSVGPQAPQGSVSEPICAETRPNLQRVNTLPSRQPAPREPSLSEYRRRIVPCHMNTD